MAMNIRDEHLEQRVERIGKLWGHKTTARPATQMLLSKVEEIEEELNLPPLILERSNEQAATNQTAVA